MSQTQTYRLAFIVMLLLFFNALNQSAFSQELVSSSGNDFKNDQLQLSWSLGESVIETYEGSSLQLTQGFHQSNLQITAIDVIPGIDFSLTAFPNPVVGYLTLKTDYQQAEKLNYLLFDSGGKLLLQADVTGAETEIPMHTYVPASYYLKVLKNNTPVKTFKIVKTQ